MFYRLLTMNKVVYIVAASCLQLVKHALPTASLIDCYSLTAQRPTYESRMFWYPTSV